MTEPTSNKFHLWCQKWLDEAPYFSLRDRTESIEIEGPAGDRAFLFGRMCGLDDWTFFNASSFTELKSNLYSQSLIDWLPND